LAYNGWKDAGFFNPQGYYGTISDNKLNTNNKYIITAELPSEAPVEVQASLLKHYIQELIRNEPEQKLHLVAHSAGGIVARLALVNYFNHNKTDSIEQLITIATPHLGSPIAEMAEQASNSPIGFIAPVIGLNEINRASILYKQLSREHENYFLFWLNRQAHPAMRYTSIIRANGSLLTGDWLVPPRSQNMAFIPVIGVNAQAIFTRGDHHLKYTDGFIIASLLP